MAYNWKSGLGGGLGGAATGAAAGSAFGPAGTAIGAGIGGVTGLLSGFEKKQNNKIRPQSTLRPEQEGLYQQLINSGMQPGAGGAFGTSADYYRNLLSDDSADYNAFAAPALRQYHEDIVPSLSEQFAGMGSGGLSSSGFRNAQIQGATDLSERLGQLRASLRQSAAQNLQGLGQMGLGGFSENVRNTPQASFGQNLAEGVGQALPSAASAYFNRPQNNMGGNQVGVNSSPYGGNSIAASPQIATRRQLPNRTF